MNYLLSNRTRRLFAIFHRHEWDDFQVKQFSKKFFNDSENDFFFDFSFNFPTTSTSVGSTSEQHIKDEINGHFEMTVKKKKILD